jgi:hypothetical protein
MIGAQPITVETPHGWMRVTPYYTPIGMRATVEKFNTREDTRAYRVEVHIDTAKRLIKKYLKSGVK